MLVFDPIVKNGSFQITFGNVTKKYRAINSAEARSKFAKFLKFNGSAADFKSKCVTTQLEPAIRNSGECEWVLKEFL